MKSTAATAEQYVASLSEERRAPVSAVRRFILEHLDADLEECMQYGVIAYCVPHRVWPQGHHTNPKLMPMYMGLSSQKNDMVVYMLLLLHNTPMREWFEKAWRATGRKSHLDVGGMGCCLRFKKVEDLSLDVIGEAMHRVPVSEYLRNHVEMLERLGRGSKRAAATPLKGSAKKPAPKAKRATVDKGAPKVNKARARRESRRA